MVEKPAVLVTRPAGQAAGLCKGLEGLGFTAHSEPMLELVAIDQPGKRQQQYIADLDRYQHIIFISGNAVRFGMRWIGAAWPGLPIGPTFHAIGSVTADSMRDCGVQNVNTARDMSSEGLLADPALQQVSGHRVLIVKGHGGRVSLREELSARGAKVDELSCYRRARPSLAPGSLSKILAEYRIGIILISSGEGLGNLLALYRPADISELIQLPLIVPSARVAGQALDMGFLKVHTAANASDAAMLQAVESWWRTNSGQSVESHE